MIFDVQVRTIFGDGAACVLLFSRDDEGPEILEEMYIFYENEHMMGLN
jgi:3-oxoacyl-[acyl-carrier-protein] synthase III